MTKSLEIMHPPFDLRVPGGLDGNFFGTVSELVSELALLDFFRNMIGTVMELVWSVIGTCLKLLWNWFGTFSELFWNLIGS